MKKLFVFILLAVMLSSCRGTKNDEAIGLNKYKGLVVASKNNSLGSNSYFLYLKEKNNANLNCIQVSWGEYDYYQKGDTIK